MAHHRPGRRPDPEPSRRRFLLPGPLTDSSRDSHFTLWAFGTWWIPLLIVLGLWRHVRRHWPLSYEPTLWSVVFPLGMYSVATLSFGKVAPSPLHGTPQPVHALGGRRRLGSGGSRVSGPARPPLGRTRIRRGSGVRQPRQPLRHDRDAQASSLTRGPASTAPSAAAAASGPAGQQDAEEQRGQGAYAGQYAQNGEADGAAPARAAPRSDRRCPRPRA